MEARTGKFLALLNLEDRANSFTHAVGTGMGLAGLVVLVVFASVLGDPWKIVSVSIFGATLVLLYATSSLYHATNRPELRKLLRIFDHVSIHLLIAGTYTPFLLVNLRGRTGWTVFGIIWGLAVAGIIKDVFLTGRFKLVSTLLYLAMGWTILAVISPLSRALPPVAMVLLLVGGLSYSLGAAFYMLDKKLPFGHAVWHLFVLGGSVCHFLSVYLGVLPRIS
jgi:hemolysin III